MTHVQMQQKAVRNHILDHSHAADPAQPALSEYNLHSGIRATAQIHGLHHCLLDSEKWHVHTRAQIKITICIMTWATFIWRTGILPELPRVPMLPPGLRPDKWGEKTHSQRPEGTKSPVHKCCGAPCSKYCENWVTCRVFKRPLLYP